ncbi:MAG: ABC transporter ATP-binding protein [Firmicutes bacterium]|nr:ABC transporter ATP-binding protein [Bacillota bacterium]
MAKEIKSAPAEKFDKIIELRNVSKVYNGVTAVDDITLSVKRGDFITLLGPSGCGKTTLLRMIAGFEEPTKGKIFIEKEDVTDLPPHKRPVNTVFQKYALFPHLSVFGNVAFGLKLKKVPAGVKPGKNGQYTKAEISEKVGAALKLVGLSGYEKRDVNTLSGGQQQRVAIARAIVLEPKVLLLDEPLGALDLKMRKEMQIELMSMHKNLGITFIYVTHDQEEALTMSDKIVVINDGAIQQAGTPKKIYDEPINAFVANFIGESNILSGTMVADYKIQFCGAVFDCEDRGFNKNEPVDLVVRPEDIKVYPKGGANKGTLAGRVLSTVFKGTYYEMNIATEHYEFTAQNVDGRAAGSEVELKIPPPGIHIMKKMRTVNEFVTQVSGEDTVEIAGGHFTFINTRGFSKGDKVTVRVPFDKVNLTDSEDDGVIGGNIGQNLYKGAYYQVQVYTDSDEDFFLDTTDEWDLDDRVGINIAADGIEVERYVEEESEENGESGESPD